MEIYAKAAITDKKVIIIEKIPVIAKALELMDGSGCGGKDGNIFLKPSSVNAGAGAGT